MNSPDRRPRLRSFGAVASALAFGAAALAGCGAGAGASPAPSTPVASTQPAVTPTDATASPTPATTPSAVATAPGSPRLLIVDPRLLDILPASVDGVPIVASPETAASMTSDLALGASASAIAVGIAVAPGDSAGDDLAIASVVRLRRGVFSDAFFAGWRTAYDAAACAPAGGVSSHREEVVKTHTVDVTGCVQDATIYHVHLANDVLVSITAAGDRTFGELILAGLRE